MVRKQEEPCTRAGLIQAPIQPELEQWLVQREQTASNICYKSTLLNRGPDNIGKRQKTREAENTSITEKLRPVRKKILLDL